MKQIPESELVLNPDGSIYHLKLKPENIADNVIVVGDQHRVGMISKYFDRIDFEIQNREFVTHTGELNNTRITVLSTGIGTDNIDIVMNELDAAVNIDLKTREVKDDPRSLNIIRLGTSGALQEDIPVDSFLMSAYGLGFDGLLNFYKDIEQVSDKEMTEAFIAHSQWGNALAKPYVTKASRSLMDLLGEGMTKGITATAPGFYGPQGRELRLDASDPQQNEKIASFEFGGYKITNYEMETSALYGLGGLLEHNMCTICTIIANRVIQQYSVDYKIAVDQMIRLVLERLTIVNK